MLIILSPSKTIDNNGKSTTLQSQPSFIEDSKILVDNIKIRNISRLFELMGISPKLVHQTYDRYQFWESEHNLSNSKTGNSII
ncbi:MAG: peroxide stress protein YaaA [Bacteroidetes bacterium]|nr:peroxide stress protein YaaA [Bacteroidota bacterium]